MNERTTFNLIFDKNSNKCDKNNGPTTFSWNLNIMTFAFIEVLGGGQLWPARLRAEFNDQLAGHFDVNSCLNEYRHTGCTENISFYRFEENSPATQNGSASFILAKR
ncbi:hypothetical protein BpHYR1_017717 [Brachionus plicatilis]|uniref:Uncharacterized protein n=1 Tax=Brachionus plicatilis TaxID=10195 RepID=A0A3M7T1I0_BRAPC|nr:hypothetical protein BpHYR1_017717 [Brachionus plicatilis]